VLHIEGIPEAHSTRRVALDTSLVIGPIFPQSVTYPVLQAERGIGCVELEWKMTMEFTLSERCAEGHRTSLYPYLL